MKKVLMSIFIIIFILSIFSVVNAASASISAGASSQKVKRGDTFTVTVIGNADDNIIALQANISYDTNKLSLIDRTVGTDFSDFSGDNEIAVATSKSSAMSKTVTLYTLTFKVLDTAAEGKEQIDFKNVSLNVANKNVNVADESVEINIEKESVLDGENDNKQENNDAKEENNTDKESEKLPQTGIESTTLILISVLAVIAVVSYVSYNKYKNI